MTMTEADLAAIIDGNLNDAWHPDSDPIDGDDAREYALWLQERDDECADDDDAPF
jgi:hypothetical protein